MVKETVRNESVNDFRITTELSDASNDQKSRPRLIDRDLTEYFRDPE